MEIYLKPWMNFAKFEGRAGRREYWTFMLVNMAINMVLTFLAQQVSLLAILGLLFTLAALVPSIAVSIRRLHDTRKSGWFLLAGFVPILGWIALFVFMVLASDGSNQFGEPPTD